MKVACFSRSQDANRNYRRVAVAMARGISQAGDRAILCEVGEKKPSADVAIIYGWKFINEVRGYPKFIYFDLGYWQRKNGYYRYSVNEWSPHNCMDFGADSARLRELGVRVEPLMQDPFESRKKPFLVLGAKRKACDTHSLRYMQWELETISRLRRWYGDHEVIYRPKPNDREKRRVEGVGYDETRSAEKAISESRLVLSHHSNAALEALAAGVPIHCVTGPAWHLSTHLEKNSLDYPVGDETRRHQILNNAAWLQFSVKEMTAGACWSHIRQKGLV